MSAIPQPRATAAAPAHASDDAAGRAIAVVCLPGDKARAPVTAFIEQLGLAAVAVPDPAASGHGTYMDRVAQLADIGYAVVVVAADVAPAAAAIELEIGFLLGALGRNRVCFIVKGDPALLPDLDGAVRHAMDDAELWHLLLARELKRGGVDIDLNRVI